MLRSSVGCSTTPFRSVSLAKVRKVGKSSKAEKGESVSNSR